MKGGDAVAISGYPTTEEAIGGGPRVAKMAPVVQLKRKFRKP